MKIRVIAIASLAFSAFLSASALAGGDCGELFNKTDTNWAGALGTLKNPSVNITKMNEYGDNYLVVSYKDGEPPYEGTFAIGFVYSCSTNGDTVTLNGSRDGGFRSIVATWNKNNANQLDFQGKNLETNGSSGNVHGVLTRR